MDAKFSTPVSETHDRIARRVLTGLFLVAWTIGSPPQVVGEHIPETTAERLLADAQQAALDGNTAQRWALLREAVRLTPDSPIPRWQLGQIQVEGDWITVEEYQRRSAASAKEAQYRELRAQYGESPQGQVALARWCRKNGLGEEAKFHWSSVLSIAPNHEEALYATGKEWFQGRLLTKSQIVEAKKTARESRHALRQWAPRIAKWERAISGNSEVMRQAALDEVRKLDDPDAIPALESVSLDADISETKETERRRKLCLAFLTALGNMTDQRSTESLVRHAVLSPMSDVRRDAAARLRYRPPHDYVPLLIGSLTAPLESSFSVSTTTDGSVHYRHTLYREGPEAKWSFNLTRSTLQHDLQGRRFVRHRDGSLEDTGAATDSATVAGKMATVAARSVNRYGTEAALVEQRVAVENEAGSASNERITQALEATTEQNFGNDPKKWADWWQDYNEYYSDGEPPAYEQSYADNRYYYYRMPEFEPPPRRYSCFAAGTLVWTKTGERPIETLELGDLVLSQDVETGELAYKPVIAHTVRPPSPILKLSFDDDELLTTRGHPFWVAGVGWRMAKELGDAAILYGVTGASRVAAVEPAPEAEAHNLVVADFNTYFVGKAGVLVHDNTPRLPTRAIVPGLVVK